MLSVVISTWNSMRYLKECLDSLSALNLDCEMIVVDSNSTDGTQQYLASLGDKVRFLRSDKRLTWSEANQIGLDVSLGDWICLSNPDIVFDDSFKKLYDYCNTDFTVNVAAPQLIYPDGTIQPPAKTITPWLSLCGHTRIIRLVLKKLKRQPNWTFNYPKGFKENGHIAVPSPQGSLFMFRRTVLDHFKGRLWNQGYLNGVSDFDTFLNLKRDSIPIWLFPDRKLIHYGSYITKRFPKWIERDQSRGLVLYFRYWQKAKTPIVRGWFSPRLYTVLFAVEGIASAGIEIIGKIVKRRNEFWMPRWTAWQAGQRILGLIDGWKYRLP